MSDQPEVRCEHTEMVHPDKLIEHPDNPNQHPPEQLRLLSAIIRQQGWRKPVVVSKRSGYITSGHGRKIVAKMNGWTVPVDYQDYDSEAQEHADLVADNKIQELSHLDIGKINPILASLVDNDEINVELSGYTAQEAQAILDGWEPGGSAEGTEGSNEPAPVRIVIKCGPEDEHAVREAVIGALSGLDFQGLTIE